VALFRETGDRWGLATALHALGMTAVVTLRLDEARAPFDESLALYRELEDTWGLARVLHYSGEMARFGGDDERARALYEESLALYQELGHQFSAAIVLHNLGYVAQHQGDPRRALACFAEAPIKMMSTAVTDFGLTPRELDVLHLMALRATHREIADLLSISPRTVMHHVSHILVKHGVTNRREAAARAMQHSIA
jgi:DNA-binding CsgD family transcriptional regulator